MSFDQTVVDMIDAIKTTMGIPITYNGAPVTALNVIYGQAGGAGTVHADLAEIEVDADDVESPQYRDTVIIEGNSNAWRVHRDAIRGLAISGDGYTWKIPLIRDERPTR